MNVAAVSPTTRFRENTVTPADTTRQDRITRSLTVVWNRNLSPREGGTKPKVSNVVTIGAVRRASDKNLRRNSRSNSLFDNRSTIESPNGSPKLGRSKDRLAKTFGNTITRGREKVRDVFSNIFPKRQPIQNGLSTTAAYADDILPPSPKLSSKGSLDEISASIRETNTRIKTAYDKLAASITKYTLSVEEKKKRIATYIGGVCVIIKAQVCHGDLKPENILWDDESFVINDFSGSISIEEMCESMNPEFRFESQEEKKAIRDIVLQLVPPNSKPIDIEANLAVIKKLVSFGVLKGSVLGAKSSKFRFSSDVEKKAIKEIVLQLVAPNSKPIDVQSNLAGFERLVEWDIFETSVLDQKECSADMVFDSHKLQMLSSVLGKKCCTVGDISDNSKFQILREYLKSQFLPDGTEGYGSKLYRIAICNYFWRCEKENFINGCNALDMRACALTIYAILTGTRPPENESDQEFYNTLERTLKTLGLSDSAASKIRRMAEPYVPPLGEKCDLPITLEELEVLQNEFHPQKKPLSVDLDVDPEKSLEQQNDLLLLEQLQESLKRLSVSKYEREEEKQILKAHEDEEQQIHVALQNLVNAISKDDISEDDEITHTLRLALIEGALQRYQKDSCEALITHGAQQYNTVLLLDPAKPNDTDVLLKKGVIGSGGSVTVHLALSLRTLKYVVIKYMQELADPREASNADKRLKQIGEHHGIQERAKLFRLQREEDYKQVVIEPFYKNRDFASCVFGDLFCSKWSIPKEHEAVRRVLEDIDKGMQVVCWGSASELDKFRELEAFIDKYGKTFTGILGIEEALALFQDYRALIGVIPKLKKLKSMEAIALQAQQLEVFKAKAVDLVQSCIKLDVDLCLDVVDNESLQNLLIDTELPDFRNAIKEEAKTVMLRLIRKCQWQIVHEYIMNTKNFPEDAFQICKKWEKAANEPGFRNDKVYLGVKGINAITKKLGWLFTVSEELNSEAKKNLMRLCEVYEELHLDKLEEVGH